MSRFFRAWICWAALSAGAAAAEPVRVRIELDPASPERSEGVLLDKESAVVHRFPVGFGKRGVSAEGASFRGGYSLLGRFRVSSLLSDAHFAMEPALLASSGKSEEFLRKRLFRNMSSLDFDGDGEGGEYGKGFIGLRPLSKARQPFGFHPYKGVFRWYGYAVHGTQKETRVGKKITGGCINVREESLKILLQGLRLGDLVEIRLRKKAAPPRKGAKAGG